MLDELAQHLEDKTPLPAEFVGECLTALFIHNLPITRDETHHHVLQYVIMRMVKKDGSFEPHHLVTQLLSPLQYCVRLAFIHLYADFEKAQPPPTSHVRRILENCLDNDPEKLWTYVTQCGVNTPFWAIRSWMHLMSHVTYTEGLPDTTTWADTSLSELRINQFSITMDQIRATIQNTFKDVPNLLASLTKGICLPLFDRAVYEDKIDVSDVGFNYLVNTRSHREQYPANFMLKTWLKNGDPWGFTSPRDWKWPRLGLYQDSEVA
ncbi:hypothetical protein PCASD_05564 [Puccinia coronata f. sp. avenae]|uniref:Uncharacterized protein n=1 Tax=Puccinia coronata f. sp. avenae TaxID=200324 RepID=A0A2N5UW26_9BASI|nr:hypothetical protein PCASD_05564 [Puccinia coronata f. sp. avenae]